MKFGLISVNVGPGAKQITDVARAAETAGIESLWTYEHVVVPVSYASRYPYSRDGKMGITPETDFVDPLIALAQAAAVTTTLKVGTAINIVPQANPLFLAKQVASLDHLSGGRVLLGVGAGWLKEEFDALGAPFARRGARMNDYLVAMKKVWSGEVVEHNSEFIQWSDFKSFPIPANKPHPPILVGGNSDAALRRVVAHGDGWLAANGGPTDLAAGLDRLWALADAAGRSRDSIEITAFWHANKGVDQLSQYEDLGVARLCVPWYSLGKSSPLAAVEALAEVSR
jgi:probable F420-dependent oxidoreductase